MAQAKKKKRFWDVDIPLISKTTNLYGFSLEELRGRVIKYDLTRLLRGKNVLLKTKVIVKDDKATSIPIELKILPSFLKKMVRKGTNYIEDSFSIPCEDAILKFKPFLVTRRKVSRPVRKSLREKANQELTEYAKDKTTETIFKDILKNQIQKPLSLKLKKIYPLSLCEIKYIKVEKELKKPKKEKTEEKKKVEETKKKEE